MNEIKMQTYTGTKVIRATLMSRGSYNTFRGWQIPANEDPNEDGYLVEYTDGGKPNDSRFEGYISWSPKDVFERAYHLTETVEQRVVLERDELNSKLRKLEDFIDSNRFKLIPDIQQDLLNSQYRVMKQYSEILELRIGHFEAAAV